MRYFNYEKDFKLERCETLHGVTIAYHTYGQMNAAKDNVVWICHHLTANSDAALWWQGVVGNGSLFDPAKHFIVCANIIGSCYGSSGPLTENSETGKPYFADFPLVTIRDMVRAHILLREHLDIPSISLLIGGSMGGYQALEWTIMESGIIKSLVLLSTSATESAWGIAVHTSQRLAIEADDSWQQPSADAGRKGLKAARAIGLISYRNHGILVKKQKESDPEKMDDYLASSYINYQGDKLVSRFNAFSYWTLTKAMDSHHISRGRNKTVAEILNGISQRTLIFGIHSDILCPLPEQEFLARHIPHSTLEAIDSAYGHDGFMVEAAIISKKITDWWK